MKAYRYIAVMALMAGATLPTLSSCDNLTPEQKKMAMEVVKTVANELKESKQSTTADSSDTSKKKSKKKTSDTTKASSKSTKETKTSKSTTASAADDKLLQTKVKRGSTLAARKAGFIDLKRYAYQLQYDPETRLPIWVAWHLLGSNTNGPYKRAGIKFAEDTDVPEPRAVNMDYVNSGYDRGHMCPSGDNRWSEQAQQESFLYTNCCPQLHNLNAGDWNELEERCRYWAETYGDVYIVCGPVFMNKQHKTIGKNKVVVPEAFYKVVLRMGKAPKAIGFIYRNEKNNRSMSSYVNTVRDVERITGLDFFSALPDDVEKAVESEASIDDWK